MITDRLTTSDIIALIVGGLTILLGGVAIGVAIQHQTGAFGETPVETVTETVVERITERATEAMAEATPTEIEPMEQQPRGQSSGERSMAITELDPILDDGIWRDGQVEIGGVPYSPSLIFSAASSTTWVEYATNSAWSKLSGSVGLADGGMTDAVARLRVYADDRPVAEIEMEAGDQAQRLSVNLADVDRVRIEAIKLSSRGGLVGVAVGEPVLSSQ